ncbi:MAG TPA: glutamate 5-kinase [Emcibacteraceae bacterium]|nr:glutamate 5-kinase [Emcibacteraceae bacterium]HRW28514.1 glutamate 5-kinase [Emcibacteraceae bacterium]
MTLTHLPNHGRQFKMQNKINILDKMHLVVIKIGSALLVDQKSGKIRSEWLTSIAEDIAELKSIGKDVIIVSSGSIALGRKILGLKMSKKLVENQAAAAIGQIELAATFREKLRHHDIQVAQVLLTFSNTEDRGQYLNARGTIKRLLKLGVVPVINENDTVATDEVRFGDNDRLAARVATMCEADLLYLLSDIDGLYTADPNSNPNAEYIEQVNEITPEIEQMAGAPVSTGFGSGGMITKIAAASIATTGGCNMVIINGKLNNPIKDYNLNGRGTWFKASTTSLASKKKWIAGALSPVGTLVIDDGAERALKNGKSLLPAGVTKVIGKFVRGDTVKITGANNVEIARGLVAYSSEDAKKIIGAKSNEIEKILGYGGREELIHRSDMVMS